jgi:hypothetical protein
MDNRIEDFIQAHREAFDFRDPDPKIWNKIGSAQKKIRGRWRIVLARAAAVILIFAASYAAHEIVHQLRSGWNESGKVQNKKIPGLSDAEAYYSNLVNQKLNELKPIMANCPALEEELHYDMADLDSVYIQLKNDLKDNMANQEVMEAIIENYKLKIHILEDLLSELEPRQNECLSNGDSHAL